jgi:hypothetical protein
MTGLRTFKDSLSVRECVFSWVKAATQLYIPQRRRPPGSQPASFKTTPFFMHYDTGLWFSPFSISSVYRIGLLEIGSFSLAFAPSATRDCHADCFCLSSSNTT